MSAAGAFTSTRTTIWGASRLGIAIRCTNRLTIKREEVEGRVLAALQHKLLQKELFAEFCQEFTRETNRLRMEARASISAKEAELTRVGREIETLIQALKNGVSALEIRDTPNGLSARKESLTRELHAVPDPKPLLDPGMADLYRTKVLNLRGALEHEDARPAAADALRGLIDAIVLKPADDGRLGIFVEGNLAAMLRLALNDKRPSELDSLEQIFPVTMVAGVGFEPTTFGL